MEAAAELNKNAAPPMQQDVEIEDTTPAASIPNEQPQTRRQLQTQPQPQGKICYGDCFACSFQQAVFCASTHARVAMRIVEQINRQYDEVMEAVGTLTQEIIDLKKQIGQTEELINPLEASADGE